MFELFARRLVMQSLDADAEYCRRRWSEYDQTAEPDLLKSWYGYFCDHYNNGTPYKVHPAESGAPLEG